MIGSFILGDSVFSISDSMYSVALDVLIKILEGLLTSDLDTSYAIVLITMKPNDC